jgi:hypothetical protein
MTPTILVTADRWPVRLTRSHAVEIDWTGEAGWAHAAWACRDLLRPRRPEAPVSVSKLAEMLANPV